MNKHYITFLIAIFLAGFLATPAFSQEKPFKLGLRVGLSSSSVSDDVLVTDMGDDNLEINVDRKRHNDFNGGGFLEYWISRSFALQLNALYLQKGTRIDAEIEGLFFDQASGQTVNLFIETKQSLLLSYLSFPLMAKFAFGGGNPAAARPFIMAGPEVGYLLSAETSDLKGEAQAYIPALGGGAAEISESGQDVKDGIESLEYAVNLGAGIIFPLGAKKIFLDGWYSLGLSQINKEGSASAKNNVVTLNLGLMF